MSLFKVAQEARLNPIEHPVYNGTLFNLCTLRSVCLVVPIYATNLNEWLMFTIGME